eukprot:TRINITY_DN17385_c0_g1_i1.p1 TRINITY_DN17385_c0_g1~~TRINITY_DN17385_c0_g1_i1.p1  ORF type:complete len:310 (+),score=53.22 TRINITY_DN17385_c0_g1_i1:50-979(+)
MSGEHERQKPVQPIYRQAFNDLAAGTSGGVALCLVGHPLDTLKVRLQTQPTQNPLYSGAIDCFRKTLQWEGPTGLYKGVLSPLLGQMFFNAVQFVIFGQTRDFLLQASGRKELSTQQGFIAGAITGFGVAFVESPVDLFKSQMQVQIFEEKVNPTAQKRYTGVVNCAQKIWRQFGIRGVYHGLGMTLMRDVPAVSIYFGVYDWGKRYLRSPDEKDLATWKLLTAGSLGGIGYWVTTYPIDVIKSSIQGDRLDPQERRFRGFFDCARKLYAEGGVQKFFRGISPCILRAGPANAACFLAYEKTRVFLEGL